MHLQRVEVRQLMYLYSGTLLLQTFGAPGLPRVRSHALFLDVNEEEPGVIIPRKVRAGA